MMTSRRRFFRWQTVSCLLSACLLLSCGTRPLGQRQKLLLSTGGLPPIVAASTSRPVTVPLIRGLGQRVPVVKATLNNRHQVPLLIDTGGNHTLISQEAADRSQLQRFNLRGEIVTAFGNKEASQLALIDSLRIGPVEYRGVQALIHSFTSRKKSEGLGSELNLIGTPALGTLSYLQLDYRRKRATFSAQTPCAAPPHPEAKGLPLSVNADGHLTVDITFPGVGVIPAVVDTGYDGVLLVDQSLRQRLRPQLVPVPQLTVKAIGPGIAQDGQVYVLPLMKIGTEIYAGVPVWSGVGKSRPVLGSGFLERFHVTFDFERMTLWLAPRDGAFKLIQVRSSAV